MKILHVNTGTEGGAAWCVRRINNSLVQQGVDSRMLFAGGANLPEGMKGAIAEPDKELWYSNYVTGKIKHLLMRLPWYMDNEKMTKLLHENNIERLYIHHPYSNYKNLIHHPLVEWADIIHLHWVSGFIDYPSFFKNVKKPIVWTLHDGHPALGLSHYSSDLFPLPAQLRNIDQFCRDVKKRALYKAKYLHTVAISEKMKELCLTSDILKDFPCSLIHNGVDTGVFRPYPIEKTEKEEQERKIFLFSSYDIWDNQKGLERVIEALEMLNDVDKKLIVIGENRNTIQPQASFPIICTGLIKDENVLSKIFSCAVYFIHVSYQESFGQTPLESMACGIPVISTPCGISHELINRFCGVLCKGYNAEAISNGIKDALSHEYNPQQIRNYIVSNYDYTKIANKYVGLYSSIMNKYQY